MKCPILVGYRPRNEPMEHAFDEMQPLKITRNVNKWAEGSALSEQGNTKVLVTATVETRSSKFLERSR